MVKRHYEKPSRTVTEHVTLLKERGLRIDDEKQAEAYLKEIGYYRLSGYFYPLLQDPKELHLYKTGALFDDAMKMYFFDRDLRLLLFSQIEEIEIAFRASIVRNGVEERSKNCLMDESCFYDKERFAVSEKLMLKEWDKSKVDFVVHYKETYTDDEYPPIWMLVEVLPLGVLANLYKNLKSFALKKSIARDFALSEEVFSSWLHSISGIRNICCHHERLWNRQIPNKPKTLKHPLHPWIDIEGVDTGRTYYKLAMLRYLLYSLSTPSHFTADLEALLSAYPSIDLAAMGFPNRWQEEALWKN